MSGNYYKKMFTDEQLAEMDRLHNEGKTYVEIASLFHSVSSSVSQALGYYRRKSTFIDAAPATSYKNYLNIETPEQKRQRQLTFLKERIR